MQSVLSRSDTKDGGTDPAGPVGPDVSVDQIQPVAEGPVGQYITRSPAGSDGMLGCTRPSAPKRDVIPVGPCWIVSKCKPNDPIADSPVGLNGDT